MTEILINVGTMRATAIRNAILAGVSLTAALAVSACSISALPGSPDPATETVTSTLTAHAGSAARSTSSENPRDSAPPSAGLTPLGNADTTRKTMRPEAPAQLLITDIRIGVHEGFERIVFDFEGTGSPGWFIDYAKVPTQQGSGYPVEYLGDIALNVNIDGTSYPFEFGREPFVLPPTSGPGTLVTEIIPQGTFEARDQFIIGMSGAYPYSVQVLENPTRLVIDVVAR